MNKKLIHNACLALTEQRIRQCQSILANINDSNHGETKSSAGDKFETSREMLKQEAEKIDRQLQILIIQKKELSLVELDEVYQKVKLGSIVVTNNGTFYIVSAIGKVTLGEGKQIFAISTKSPMAVKLWGLGIGENAVVNNREISILEIY